MRNQHNHERARRRGNDNYAETDEETPQRRSRFGNHSSMPKAHLAQQYILEGNDHV
jgi:hypothetical protein